MNEVKITVHPFMIASNVYQQAFKIVEECGEVMAELYNADRKEIVNVEDIKSIGYELGDVVAVQDIFTKNIEDVQITEVSKSYRQGQQRLSLTFGKPKQNPLQKIVNDFLSGTARRR